MSNEELLEKRSALTIDLQDDPYRITSYLERCTIYATLGYPDLAAMDAYKVMLLVDEILEDSGDWHEEAVDSFRSFLSSATEVAKFNVMFRDFMHGTLNDGVTVDQSSPQNLGDVQGVASDIVLPFATLQMAHHLVTIGCLRTAHDFIRRIVEGTNPVVKTRAEAEMRRLKDTAGESWNGAAEDLADEGLVCRHVYPWNNHENDRNSLDALQTLNEQLAGVAPKLEVKLSELPTLTSAFQEPGSSATNVQLGLFAKEDLAPGEVILRERSMLTANNRLHDPLCDACSAALPETDGTSLPEASDEPAACPDCDDTVFCSQTCLSIAQQTYHRATCGQDIDSISRDVPAAESADALHRLLLLRVLALSLTQDIHPLDLPEVKYIWGDFTPVSHSTSSYASTTAASAPTTEAIRSLSKEIPSSFAGPRILPFSFTSHCLTPLTFLAALVPPISLFAAPHDLAEAWLYSTLYAKFRGTASARFSSISRAPEVAAVHPLWCLANHDCAPNVAWEWGGEVAFTVRDEPGPEWKRPRVRSHGVLKDEVGDGVGIETESRDGLQVDSKRGSTAETGTHAEEGAAAKAEVQIEQMEVKSTTPASGIKAGEEILNHYVDISLPVEARRAWGKGSLGGACMCRRCRWESFEGE